VIDQSVGDVCNHTSSTNAYKRRPYSHLAFTQLLWWRSNIMFDSHVFLAVVSCGSHLAMFLLEWEAQGLSFKLP
jgi:hypothetical protein